MLNKRKKERIIAKYKTHDSDTGSSQVQIAILTEEIKELTKHLKTHKKDFSSRRGLLKKVAERRRLLSYLRREDEKSWEGLVKDLKLKVPKAGRELEKEEDKENKEDKVEKTGKNQEQKSGKEEKLRDKK